MMGGTAIPSLSALFPSINPGLPTPLAEAMGLPQNSTPIVHYCSDHVDCFAGGGVRQQCWGGHKCGCSLGNHEYPFCVEPTYKTRIDVGCWMFLTVIWAVVLLSFIGILYKRIRTTKMEKKCLVSFFSTTTLSGLLGSGCILAHNAIYIDMMRNPYDHAESMFKEYGICTWLRSLCGLCIALSFNNVSMMWIEFALASKRMASMSSNLKLTKNFIFGYSAFYMVAGVTFLYITIGPYKNPIEPIEPDFEYATTGLLVFNALLTSATYFYGGRAMYLVFSRHAEQEKSSRRGCSSSLNKKCKTSTQTATSTDQTEEGMAADEEEQMKAREAQEAEARSDRTIAALQKRGRMIVSTTVVIVVASLTIAVSLIYNSMPRVGENYVPNWILVFLLNISLSSGAMAVARFLNSTMESKKPSSGGGGKTGNTVTRIISARFSKKRVTPAKAYTVSARP